MSTLFERHNGLLTQFRVDTWLPVAVGFLVLYLPTYLELSRDLWTREEYLHGPIVLAVFAWLVWQARSTLRTIDIAPARLSGWICMCFGLALYAIGRSQDIIILEVSSQIPVGAGILLLLWGRAALWKFAFPLAYLLFMLPLPGFIVDALTSPLKREVSIIAEEVLYLLGYPVARTGVVLSVGPYQLLVADACSGLHSLVSISAMGVLYVYLMRSPPWWRSAILLACLLPIGFIANVVRVVVLVLITYHFGDEAGQGFIHGFSGVFLFIVGLLCLFGIDMLIGKLRRNRLLRAQMQ